MYYENVTGKAAGEVEVEDFNKRLSLKGGNFVTFVIVLFGLFIMSLNSFSTLALYRSVHMEVKIRLLSINLAASDTLVGFNLVMFITSYTNNAASSPLVCNILITLPRLTYFAGIFTTTSFAIDRFLCLYRWQTYNRHISRRTMALLCVGVWTLSAILTAFSYWGVELNCRTQVEIDEFREQGVLPLLILTIICFLLIFMCYLAVFVNIKNHLKKTRNMGISSREYCFSMFRSTLILSLIVLAFIACYGPIFSFKICNYFYPDSTWNTRETRLGAQFIFISNSVINPIIYAWRFTECRLEMKLLCTFKRHKKEAIQQQKKLLFSPFLQQGAGNSNTRVFPS